MTTLLTYLALILLGALIGYVQGKATGTLETCDRMDRAARTGRQDARADGRDSHVTARLLQRDPGDLPAPWTERGRR